MKLTVKWSELPQDLRAHLSKRLKDRSITAGDLHKLQFWFESGPDVPEGDWYKDFGTFILAGPGPLPLTFLSPGQVPHGEEITDTDVED